MTELRRSLSLYGLTMIAIGCTIGSGIFRTPGNVALPVHLPEYVIALWVLGGVVALAGALTFDTAAWIWQQLQDGLWLTRAREADLSGITDADSAGLALLIAWRASVSATGGVLKFEAVPERLVALARLTEAESLLA